MPDYSYSVALITVTDTETTAAKNIYDWRERRFDGDNQIYLEAEFEKNGKKYNVVSARQNEMGMTACAALSMKLIYRYRPRYLIMVGIAAGVAAKDVTEQEYGDVIVADMIWNYSVGKYVNPDRTDIKFGNVGFIPRPTVVKLRPEVEKYIRLAAESEMNECHVHIGPMASGSAVVASSEILNKQIRTQFKHTAGLDMEAYAVMYTAENATEPRPSPIVIKSVCDFADSTKSDEYQLFAACTSCEFAKLLYEVFLPLEGKDIKDNNV